MEQWVCSRFKRLNDDFHVGMLSDTDGLRSSGEVYVENQRLWACLLICFFAEKGWTMGPRRMISQDLVDPRKFGAEMVGPHMCSHMLRTPGLTTSC